MGQGRIEARETKRQKRGYHEGRYRRRRREGEKEGRYIHLS